MKCKLAKTKKLSLLPVSLLFAVVVLGGCASLPNIVPQLPSPRADNYSLPAGQDIGRANAFLTQGKKREAAAAYFEASNNYRSPERERLILQAAELAAVLKDTPLTQRYLAPVNYANLNAENQARFRFTQAQLALNDNNYRETLRILPQRVNTLPMELGTKILNARMSAAQSSGDKLALVQELVLQESSLKEQHQIDLNHDRIWNHAQQIPNFQLDEGIGRINHPVLKSWLTLAKLGKISKSNTASAKTSLRGDTAKWLQQNPNHPGKSKAIELLNVVPSTTVTPYQTDATTNTTNSTVAAAKPGQSSSSKKQIAVLLPLTGNLSGIGKTLLSGIQDAHKLNPNNSELKVLNTASGSIDGIYRTALNGGAQTVIGPFIKPALSSLSRSTIPVPTIGLNYVEGLQNTSGNLYQFGLSPEDEARQIVDYAMSKGLQRVAILTPDSDWGNRLHDAMRRATIEKQGKVVMSESFRNSAISYAKPAESIGARENELDAILVAASPTQIRRLYPDLRQKIRALPVYATSHVYSGLPDTDKDSVLEGLVFTETPWVLDSASRQNSASSAFPRLYAMGMDAYKLSSSTESLKAYGSTVSGKTGTISLEKDGSFHRKSGLARFNKGVAMPFGG
ncbi:penicillin-binding protein activator [Cocleimonas sp. KMM 6892]|uniref:penicillin-binding protein activator n=1 Tax=unclassified Cocleimonas TaxID=2639732 RepID=UPI002DC0444F|nr:MULTISPECIES: penicillin-binding protein activator [unclassified Cocleimonas]MEB8430629.1 penicillin-binding protein activator [Cocleimonas sp. KMM 6892]MEC4716920.1 penicillin-binding protein activator [Cocleimonas sp. KMM 6895]MEC4743932.1 penicillin-binding protein activator [Cocleimonas sp. KMM 6896]